MLKRLFASKKRPCFRNLGPWETRTFDLSGCKLEVTLPPHDYEFPESDSGGTYNLFDSSLYRYNSKKNKSENSSHNGGVSVPGILLRKWDSYGSIFSVDPIGLLQCSLIVYDVSKMEEDLNCFDKKHMENLMIHALYYCVGPGFGNKQYKAPLNWAIKTINRCEWIYCDAVLVTPEWKQVEEPHRAAHFISFVAAPLFKDKFLFFSFTSLGSLPAKASNHLMHQRIDRIISSFKLELSPEVSYQKEEAEKNSSTTKYSECRDPEPWQFVRS